MVTGMGNVYAKCQSRGDPFGFMKMAHLSPNAAQWPIDSHNWASEWVVVG